MENRKDVTVPMPGELVERIDQQLDYGDSRAAWIREACEQRLEREEGEEGNSETPAKMATPATSD